MKKLFFIITSILIYLHTFAQTNKVHVGLRAGLNNSIYVKEVTNQSFTIVGQYIGYHGGPMLYIEPKRFIGINTGIIFNTSGWVDEVGAIADTVLYRKDVFQNIQVPVTIAIRIGIQDKFRIHLEGGMYGNYVLQGYSSFKDIYGELHEKSVEFAKFRKTPTQDDYSYRKLYAGGIVGLGVSIQNFTFGCNYNLGFVNLTNQSTLIQNHFWQIYFGIRTID